MPYKQLKFQETKQLGIQQKRLRSVYRFASILSYENQFGEALKNDDFFALKQAMWQELPEALIATEDEKKHEEEVLIGFSRLFQLAEYQDLRLKDETRYTSRWLQCVITFHDIGFYIQKLPKHIAGFVPFFYEHSCFRSGDQRKYQEAKELHMFIRMNASWLF